MTEISRITKATTVIDVMGAPRRVSSLKLMTDSQVRAASKRAVFIVADEAEMRGLADAAAWFARCVENTRQYPYDHCASPSCASQ
jgi:hypothetical protein